MSLTQKLMASVAALASTVGVSVAQAAPNDSFVIIRDGREFICELTAGRDPSDALECVEKAYRGSFSRTEATRLCSGALSIAPAECAEKAYRKGSAHKLEAIELCRAARTDDPAECFEKAYRGPFTRVEAVRLCKHNGNVKRAECAIKAYRGPYSREEAIRICSGGDVDLLLRSLRMMETSNEVKAKVQQFKATNSL